MRGEQFFSSVAAEPPFSYLHPRLSEFFKGYLAKEKVIDFRGQKIVNSHLPPYPSGAFAAFARQFDETGVTGASARLFSVTWAVTNRCSFQCWHCYNAGRSQIDLPLSTAAKVAQQLQERGAIMVTLTGGEPLLRDDLEQIAAQFSDATCLVLGTTGDGLTPARARSLKKAGIFACGISLDSTEEQEHDRLRGRRGAFKIALHGLHTAADAGLFPYVIAVASHEFLRGDVIGFLQFAGRAGAREVHLLEPCAAGRLATHHEVILSDRERAAILELQATVAQREDLPILSSLPYLESAEVFGCGAGLTHLYIDGAGDVCPCNLVPMSFGNLQRQPLAAILENLGRHFREPRTRCAGRTLTPQVYARATAIPAPPEESAAICERCLPREHDLPAFFQARKSATQKVGQPELASAYDRIHGFYDDFWLSEAAAPVLSLIRRLALRGDEKVFEAGCGTGFATAQIALRLSQGGSLLATDISAGMIQEARNRVGVEDRVRFLLGEALANLQSARELDLVFSSWVLGYIPLAPFFAAVQSALACNGRLAFIVHRQHSPRRPLKIFAELLAENPRALMRQVYFDFPEDCAELESKLHRAGLKPVFLTERAIHFHYPTAEGVLEHLLKSGAGTAFHDALDPALRPELEARFLARLRADCDQSAHFTVTHDYFCCIAQKKDSGRH